MSMYIHKHVMKGSACLKIQYLGVEISVAFDDSCGCMEHLGRIEAVVFDNEGKGGNITHMIHPDMHDRYHPSNLEELMQIQTDIKTAKEIGRF